MDGKGKKEEEKEEEEKEKEKGCIAGSLLPNTVVNLGCMVCIVLKWRRNWTSESSYPGGGGVTMEDVMSCNVGEGFALRRNEVI